MLFLKIYILILTNINMIDIEEIRQKKPIKELLEFSIINIDKPSGPTSFGVDKIIKETLNLRKTSHFGTLDPAVTGVLPIALNRACKLMNYFMQKNKTYVGIMRTHKETELKELEKIIKEFTGKISQVPPLKSRVKRQERKRTVFSFKIIEKNGKDFLFETEVEAGTYIRKLIHDIGLKIGGAHMLELRRTKASIFEEKNSHMIYEFIEAVEEYKKGNENKLRKMFIPAEIISKIYNEIQIKKSSIDRLFHGSPLYQEDLEKSQKMKAKLDDKIAVFNEQNFIGVFKTIDDKRMLAKPEFVLQPIR